ncbi:hypothetical protein BT69DRAFT_1280030 [Atractiella rhizophila]|nr:hypothetical protein BT69DRAFT_1280030 [Atractiella rhizophila]
MSHPYSHIPGIFYDFQNKEPFVPLPDPLSAYRLTVWRKDDSRDIESLVKILNDGKVHPNLLRIPYPYKREDGEFYSNWRYDELKPTLDLLRASDNMNEFTSESLKACPFEVIRYSEDPAASGGRLLGMVAARKLDEGTWELSDYLDPSEHGKGVMTACIGTTLTIFSNLQMNSTVQLWVAKPFVGNWASRRVFEKNGFVFSEKKESMKTMKGDGKEEERIGWVMEKRNSLVSSSR